MRGAVPSAACSRLSHLHLLPCSFQASLQAAARIPALPLRPPFIERIRQRWRKRRKERQHAGLPRPADIPPTSTQRSLSPLWRRLPARRIPPAGDLFPKQRGTVHPSPVSPKGEVESRCGGRAQLSRRVEPTPAIRRRPRQSLTFLEDLAETGGGLWGEKLEVPRLAGFRGGVHTSRRAIVGFNPHQVRGRPCPCLRLGAVCVHELLSSPGSGLLWAACRMRVVCS